MDKRKIIIIAVVVILILLLAGGTWLGLRARSRSVEAREAQERLNALSLARTYMEKEEYDRAMEILEKLLLKDPNDGEAQDLLDEVIDRKKLAQMSDREREQQALLEQQERLKEGLKNLSSSIQEKLPQETVVVRPKEIPEDGGRVS